MILVAGMIVSSDAAFLKFSLPSLRRQVDHVIIVEGADERWVRKGNAKPTGESLDDTSEVIERELARQEAGLAPITYVQPSVYPHRNAQRQVCLDEMAKVGAQICLIVDADEFYHDAAIKKIRQFFTETDAVAARWPFYNFYSFVRRQIDDAPMERCFRYEEGLHYPDVESGQYAIRSSGLKVWKFTSKIDGVVTFHYNRIFDGAKLLTKIRFYLERDYGLGGEAELTLAQLGKEDVAAITKAPALGVFVPFSEQPPYARLLAYSDIAPVTSASTFSDLAGAWLPTFSVSGQTGQQSKIEREITELGLQSALRSISAPSIEEPMVRGLVNGALTLQNRAEMLKAINDCVGVVAPQPETEVTSEAAPAVTRPARMSGKKPTVLDSFNAFCWILGRPPENLTTLLSHSQESTMAALRLRLLLSKEFGKFFASVSDEAGSETK